MRTNTRQKLIMAAITAVTLSAVLLGGCSADAPESGLPQTHVTTVTPNPGPCELAWSIPDYVVSFEDGSESTITPRDDVREDAWMVADGQITPAQHQAMCSLVVGQAVADGQPVTVR